MTPEPVPPAAPTVPEVVPSPEPPDSALPAGEPVREAQPAAPTLPEPLVLPTPLPPLRPIAPSGEGASILRLGPPASLDLPSLDAPAGGSIITLAPPDAPAEDDLPTGGGSITVLPVRPLTEAEAGRFRDGTARVRRGDTLWGIAREVYGRGSRYRTILRANRDSIPRPPRIYPGQVLELPLVYDD